MKLINTTSDIKRWVEEIIGTSNPPVALTMEQELESVEDRKEPIFPPTFAPPEGGGESGYNIDKLNNGSETVIIDTVGSQANRIEPLFMEEEYADLVPQVPIKFRSDEISIFELPHRAADATIKSAPKLSEKFEQAFKELKESGDATPLVSIAPTSLVFGVWDSRGTQEKRPRIVKSTIRANKISKLTRSSQYIPAISFEDEGASKEYTKDDISKAGFAHVPAAGTPGGVLLDEGGKIIRSVVVNLIALRRVKGKNSEETEKIQKYLFGLSLVSASYDIDLYLREGCNLKISNERDLWFEQPRRGSPIQFELGDDFPDSLLEFTREAASPFKNSWNDLADTVNDTNIASTIKSQKNAKKSKKSNTDNSEDE